MPNLTKAELDKMVRSAGEQLIDVSELILIQGSTYMGKTEVDGVERFFEIKVTAKSIDFDADSLQAKLDERAEIEERKLQAKIAADKKKAKDKAKREKAKAEEEVEIAE